MIACPPYEALLVRVQVHLHHVNLHNLALPVSTVVRSRMPRLFRRDQHGVAVINYVELVQVDSIAEGLGGEVGNEFIGGVEDNCRAFGEWVPLGILGSDQG